MQVDSTLANIFATIQQEVKAKFKVELSIESIYAIVHTQILATRLGVIHGITIHWRKFAKFIHNNRKERNVDTLTKLKEIQSDKYDLTAQEREVIRKDYIVQRSIEKKQTLQREKKVTRKVKVQELIKNSTIPTFSMLNNKHK